MVLQFGIPAENGFLVLLDTDRSQTWHAVSLRQERIGLFCVRIFVLNALL